MIFPIPKISSPEDIGNDLRQICLLPQIAKILEKLQLQLNAHDLKVKDNQHAFTKSRPIATALLSTSQQWFGATDNSTRKSVHIILEDCRKAFDLVDNGILLRKVDAMHVTKSFWNWIKTFLTGKTQQVNLQGAQSSIP